MLTCVWVVCVQGVDMDACVCVWMCMGVGLCVCACVSGVGRRQRAMELDKASRGVRIQWHVTQGIS